VAVLAASSPYVSTPRRLLIAAGAKCLYPLQNFFFFFKSFSKRCMETLTIQPVGKEPAGLKNLLLKKILIENFQYNQETALGCV
jgi:hypothetical protein